MTKHFCDVCGNTPEEVIACGTIPIAKGRSFCATLNIFIINIQDKNEPISKNVDFCRPCLEKLINKIKIL